MNELLEKIGVVEARRPEFDNSMLGVSELTWFSMNRVRLATWFMELQQHEEVIDIVRVVPWMRLQYAIELKRQEPKT